MDVTGYANRHGIPFGGFVTHKYFIKVEDNKLVGDVFCCTYDSYIQKGIYKVIAFDNFAGYRDAYNR